MQNPTTAAVTLALNNISSAGHSAHSGHSEAGLDIDRQGMPRNTVHKTQDAATRIERRRSVSRY
jgi:hypothetical protein